MTRRLSITLSALLALAQSVFVMPAMADTVADSVADMATVPAAPRAEQAAPLEACPPAAKAARLAQVAATECCKDQKGICGCRAGKIVCCDSKPSTHPGCTCHGDNGFIE